MPTRPSTRCAAWTACPSSSRGCSRACAARPAWGEVTNRAPQGLEGSGAAKGVGGVAKALSGYVLPGLMVLDGDRATHAVAPPPLLEIQLQGGEMVIHFRGQIWLRDVAGNPDAFRGEEGEFLPLPGPPGPLEALPVDFPPVGLAETVAIAGMAAEEGTVPIGPEGGGRIG